jgi:hypothetical protein
MIHDKASDDAPIVLAWLNQIQINGVEFSLKLEVLFNSPDTVMIPFGTINTDTTALLNQETLVLFTPFNSEMTLPQQQSYLVWSLSEDNQSYIITTPQDNSVSYPTYGQIPVTFSATGSIVLVNTLEI